MRTGWFAVSLLLVFGLAFLGSVGDVRAASTTTTVQCVSGIGINVVAIGQSLTCTATVAGSAPTGTVSWSNTGSGSFSPSASCTLSSGSCSVQYTPTSAAATSVAAAYGGFGSNDPSTSADVTITVNRASPTVSVLCSPSPVGVGSSTTCTGQVNGGYNVDNELISFSLGVSTGKVSFTGGTTCQLSSGVCGVTVRGTGSGAATIQVSYQGDVNNNGPVSQTTSFTISKATSSTTVVCAPATVLVGQQATCTATVSGYSPTGIISWLSSDQAGVFSANPCTLGGASCGVSYTAKSSATVTASYIGDFNNTASLGTFSITANINQMIQITVANSGPATSVTLSGCNVSPTTVYADGTQYTFTASSGCTGIVASLPPAGANVRYLTAGGQGSLTIGSCSSSSCQTFSATIYYQVQNTYQASPKSPAAWSAAGSIVVTGTALGQPGLTVCTITVATGAGQFSCQGWTDYKTQAIMGVLQVSPTQRWATAQSAFTDTLGGTQHNSDYFSQVLENFQYSLVGSTTAPTPPRLNYTAFGGTSTFPLTGSGSLLWLDTGSSWSVPAALAGSTSSERWEGSVTSGAATAGQTVPISYYHQFLVNFAYVVIGGGSGLAPPTVSFTALGASTRGLQSWVDAGSAYNYTNPLAGSTGVERWFTSTPLGVISGAATVSAGYYHQYAFALNFTVSGAGLYNNPRLNYTSFGSAGLRQVNATQATFWVDAGTGWGVSPLLPSSSSTERWITKQATSGTATSPLQAKLLYYHQFLGALHYSIKGPGGSPPVPRVNYTSLGAGLQLPLNGSSTYWIDSGSIWSVPLTMPGGPGERWLSNVTAIVTAVNPFQLDAQYTHQFFVAVGVSTPAGGAVGNTNQWHDQGSSVVLTATSAKLWSFAYWRGATLFSYNGTTLTPTLLVTGAANETAIFFPGLSILAGTQGSVAYSYGSITGTVPAGTNATIYVPPGRSVTLTAVPNNVEIVFEGWTGDLPGGQLQSASVFKLQTSVSIDSPGVVHASFALDYTDIRTFAVAALGVFIAASYVFVIRRGFAPKIRQ